MKTPPLGAGMGQCQEWQQAVELISGMKRTAAKPTLITHNTVMGALAGDGHWQKALTLKLLTQEA